jgi:DNA repair exonuclease SbcCD ATPase subunit
MVNVNPTDKLVFDLEMFQIDFNDSKKESLRKEISEKYGVPVKNVEINFVPITVSENGEKISLASDIITNIQDPKFQQQLFKDYLDAKEIKDYDFEELLNIDKRVNSFIDFNTYSKYKPYKIKYLKWNNYLSYGKDNYFDFTKLKGLVLLTGQPENTSGKTTLAIDLLRFALFGKAEKSPTLDSVFNTYLEDETEVMVEAGIEIEGVEYVIRRTVTRPSKSRRTSKSKTKQKVEYFKNINGNFEEIENCEGESGTQTNNIIRETVGNIEDFDLVISATAYSLGNLLRMGQTDKGRLFSRWLGLLTIEEKERIAKELWKKESQTLLSNRYDKASLESEIEDMKSVIDSDNKAIISSQEKLNAASENIDRYNKEKLDIIKNRKEIKEELIRADVTTIENQTVYCNNELMNQRAIMKSKKERYMQIKDVSFDLTLYNSKKEEERNIDIEQAELRTKILSLKDDNKRIEALVEKKTCPTCGHEIDLIEQGSFINANNNKINEYKEKGVLNKNRLDEIKKDIAELEARRNDENELNRLKPEMSAIKVKIDNLKLKIADLERRKSEIETNKDNIRYNDEIDNKIRIIDESIKVETSIKEQQISNIQDYKNETVQYGKQINERENIIKRLSEEELKIRNWNIYQELIGKNGIVKIVLKRALPILNNEISRLMNGLCDFEVRLSIDDSNKICLDLIRDGVSMPIENAASGWETTISSIALRSALSNICSFAKPNFVTYDEVLSGVSSENSENIFKLFRRILPNYDCIIHICHDNSLDGYHDSTVTIVKEDNISKIVLK